MTLEQNYPEWSGKPVAEALNDCHRYAIAVIVRTQGLRQSLLKEALTSISVQSNPCLALVMVHAGAEMLERVESVCREIPSLSWVLIHADRIENKRGYPLNIGLQYACAFLNDTEAIAFLDDDDILYSNFSARMIQALSETDADVICAASNRSAQNQAVEEGYRPSSFMNLFIYNFIPINSYIIRVASFAKKPVFFDETLDVVEDWYFLLQLLQNGFRFEAITDILSEFRIISDGNKQIKDNPEKWSNAYSYIYTCIRDSSFLLKGQMIQRLMMDQNLKDGEYSEILASMHKLLDEFESCAFSEADYLSANPDVAELVISGNLSSGREHWIKYGKKENRKFSIISWMSQMNPLLVSIIVRTKDRPKLLLRALQSIAAQTYRPMEVVLVNDGGCHLEADKLKDILGDVSLNYIELEKTSSRAHAGNIGIKNAKGSYVGFLEDDDIYSKDAIRMLCFAMDCGGWPVVYGQAVLKFYNNKGMIDTLRKSSLIALPFDKDVLLYQNAIPFNTILFDERLFRDFGPFDESLSTCEKWDFLLKIADKHHFKYIPEVVVEHSSFGAFLNDDWFTEKEVQEAEEVVRLKRLDRATISIIKKQIAFAQNEIKQSITRYESEKLEYHNVKALLDAEIERLKAEQSESESEIKQLKAEQNKSESEIEQLKAEQNKLEFEIEIERLKAEQNKSKSEIERLMAEQNKSESEIERLMAEQNKSESEIERLKYEQNKSEFEIERLKYEQNKSESEIERVHYLLDMRGGELTVFEDQIADLNQTIQNQQDRIADLNQIISCHESQIDITINSKSWQLTSPLRALRRFPRELYLKVRSINSNIVRSIWGRLPLQSDHKIIFKNVIFRNLPTVFSKTLAYRVWKADKDISIEDMSSTELSQANVITNDGNDLEAVQFCPFIETRRLQNIPIRLIAFYLPQFHPIPENDAWWGKGFTEWTNVTKAIPQFVGHYQPRLPSHLGFYDLRLVDVQRNQVELAKIYGIGGFCFYFYWFGGKRLLETPIEQYLMHPELDLPFCLCWANENWSRRWDGLDDDILLSQKYSPEDDMAFIEYVSKYFRDPRYIRVDGRPLLLVYRPALLHAAKNTAQRWREWCRENGIGEIYLACTQSFEKIDPINYGFDAAVEFPPNNSDLPSITEQMNLVNPKFAGAVYDWRELVERSYSYSPPEYKLFRGVCPSWDNTARRAEGGTIFYGSTPECYAEWLENAAMDTVKRFPVESERIVFVNAWNEWAEGAYLEPDQRFGYAYLQATRDALQNVAIHCRVQRIVLVTHDCHPHGAQYLALHLAKSLFEEFGYGVDLVSLGDGPLEIEFKRFTLFHSLAGKDSAGPEAHELAEKLYSTGMRFAITNTTVAGSMAEILKKQGFKVVSLIHELPGMIEQHCLQLKAKLIGDSSDYIVFPACQVRSDFEHFAELDPERIIIKPQGLYKRNSCRYPEQIEEARKELRSRFALPQDSQIVLSVGYADHRKGIDLFVKIAAQVLSKNSLAVFIWVGHFDVLIEAEIKLFVEQSGFGDRIIFAGLDFQTDHFFAGSDVYALTSREDPFPSVILQSLDAAKPVVAFYNAGGFTDLIEGGCGRLAPAFDVNSFSQEILYLLANPDDANRLGMQGQKIVEREFSFRRYVFDLLGLIHAPPRKVSVIVPNYNYGRYLEGRLMTVAKQTTPIYEMIVLDDGSSDSSVSIARNILDSLAIDHELLTNDENTGSVFKQWLKGVELAKGDFVWIAEADDLAAPEFLQTLLSAFDDPSVVMSYCQSKQMCSDGSVLCEDYFDYLRDIDPQRWNQPYVSEGIDEIRRVLAVKNTIPNVSAVVFRREVLLSALREKQIEISSMHVAGDWMTYLYVLQHGKIAFASESLNYHRRHEKSVTIGSFGMDQLAEIIAVQCMVCEQWRPDSDVTEKANAYAQSLYEQFNLATDDAPTYDKNQELMQKVSARAF